MSNSDLVAWIVVSSCISGMWIAFCWAGGWGRWYK